eukprot:TRINITY_DN14275_c0_g1_i1.p1 TRINITY_DN14275_c0_g1~~TRINITY_DN14275_c0_g1_i1.p1  ORF type:complete len:172 (-),score=17.94 TRINITY_DN14275_c0_g1_i1:265-780(-)
MFSFTFFIISLKLVSGLPSYYRGCDLPTRGTGNHAIIINGFSEDSGYSFEFTDLDGNEVDFVTPNQKYLITVSGDGPLRAMMTASSGTFEDPDSVLPLPCEGLRIDLMDYVSKQTAQWVAGDSEVTFAVNLASSCSNNFFQNTLTIPVSGAVQDLSSKVIDVGSPTPEMEG